VSQHNPANPICQKNSWAGQPVASASTAFVGHGESILVLDVSEPRGPRLAGGYETLGVVWGIQVVDALVYVANGTRGVLVLPLKQR